MCPLYSQEELVGNNMVMLQETASCPDGSAVRWSTMREPTADVFPNVPFWANWVSWALSPSQVIYCVVVVYSTKNLMNDQKGVECASFIILQSARGLRKHLFSITMVFPAIDWCDADLLAQIHLGKTWRRMSRKTLVRPRPDGRHCRVDVEDRLRLFPRSA